MTNPAYEPVLRLITARTGLKFTSGSLGCAERGVGGAMSHAGIADPARFAESLAHDDRAFDALVDALTVGETYFFREPEQFQFLAREVLPDIHRRLGSTHVLRLWSAGCATGEEAYSLAILCEQHGLAGQIHLLATDISRTALAQARLASYGPWSLRGTGADAVRPYLRRQGERLVLDERLRRRVDFAYLNLALDTYPSFTTGTWGMDVILCRNVLIYFDADTVRQVAQRLYACLAPGGWLITASVDPPLADAAPFETVAQQGGIFYRRAAWPTVPAEPAPLLPAAPVEPLVAPAPPLSPVRDVYWPMPPDTDPLEQARAEYARGEYRRVVERTRELLDEAAAVVLHVRALANLDVRRAEQACAAGLARHSLSPELHYLQAVLLLDLGRFADAERAARRVLYLDHTLAAGHLTLGAILERRGDAARARKAYRNARELCQTRPADEVVPLADGEQAGRLAEAASARLVILDQEASS